MIELQGERATVIGLGRSGLAAAKLLHDLGARVTVTENSENEEIKKRVRELRGKGIQVEIGGHSREVVLGSALIVASPGVPPDSAPLQLAREKGVEVISELELGARFCPGRIIGVTGTNGKSTTVTLIAEIFKANGGRALVAGNIGIPICSLADRIREEDIVVLEVSSFQLETIKDFKPFVSVLLNLTPDHLNRYNGSFSQYLEVKKRIFT
ncbi:UDP-N-acetylmuramoyl-L-alanine--D-glutamate ligase, partial [bacterium]|nr:UDP-N-acetylmuramoyl-L-alanine--D-glutamate ligase [bacterium]